MRFRQRRGCGRRIATAEPPYAFERYWHEPRGETVFTIVLPRDGTGGSMAQTRAQATQHPHFRALTRTECEELLGRNNVGRIAFSFHDRVDIEPLHYVYADGWIYGRTSAGTKIATLEHHRWVAFEVDEHQGLFDWRSVVVKGAFYELEADGNEMREDPMMAQVTGREASST
jgi:hypothetical protein